MNRYLRGMFNFALGTLIGGGIWAGMSAVIWGQDGGSGTPGFIIFGAAVAGLGFLFLFAYLVISAALAGVDQPAEAAESAEAKPAGKVEQPSN